MATYPPTPLPSLGLWRFFLSLSGGPQHHNQTLNIKLIDKKYWRAYVHLDEFKCRDHEGTILLNSCVSIHICVHHDKFRLRHRNEVMPRSLS